MLRKVSKLVILLLILAAVLSGCNMRTVDQLYCLPKRSEAYNNLQAVIDEAMDDLSYCTPSSGENRQAVQLADLDGDGVDEYLLFAKDDSEKPLKILVFCQLASGYVLMDTIEGYGFAFDFVTYAQMDDRPGVEIIVGRQVSNELVRSVSVYRFTSGFSRQLLSTSYSRLVTSDLDQDGKHEMLVLRPGESEGSRAAATIFRFQDGEIQRSEELEVSESADSLRRVGAGILSDGLPAVYVTCATDENSLTTDILAMRDGQLGMLCQGITVPALHNYYVYPSDLDGDDVLEMPELIPMQSEYTEDTQEYLIRWYSLDSSGNETTKQYTFHNFSDNWYLQLENTWIQQMWVEQSEGACVFYMGTEKLLTVYTLTDTDQEDLTQQEDMIVLYSSDSVICAAKRESAALKYGITAENLPPRFCPIRGEMTTEEDS